MAKTVKPVNIEVMFPARRSYSKDAKRVHEALTDFYHGLDTFRSRGEGNKEAIETAMGACHTGYKLTHPVMRIFFKPLIRLLRMALAANPYPL